MGIVAEDKSRQELKMAVGKVKRGLSLGTAIVEQYFYSGLLVGWASLVYILKEEGVYGDLCDESEVTDGASSGIGRFNYVLGLCLFTSGTNTCMFLF